MAFPVDKDSEKSAASARKIVWAVPSADIPKTLPDKKVDGEIDVKIKSMAREDFSSTIPVESNEAVVTIIP
jgi:hypothetical protein